MSKKRGLSLEEKRERMLQIFYDSQDFYLLKELEKLGPRKGVISQSVKDVVQSLVDDDLVSKDKIGTSVYFWSLPSCAGNQLRNVSKKLESELQSSKKRHVELVQQCESLKKGREDSDAREEALSELKAIEEKYNKLKEEMGQYADNDPATFEAMKDAIKVAHEAANRWTDNIFTLRQWCSNNFPQAKEQLEHLYNEDCEKFMRTPLISSIARPNRSKTSESGTPTDTSDAHGPFDVEDENENEDEDERPRPIGRNAARYSASGSTGGASSGSVSRLLSELSRFNTTSREILETRRKDLDLRERDLKFREQEAEDKKKRRDYRFYISSHEHLSGGALETTLAMKEELRQKYGWPPLH